jgi:succinoglycan biosynthesis protein ExoM
MTDVSSVTSAPSSAVKPNPLVTVIVPTFHRPAGAMAAVRSVFAQINAPSFEVLLVDNDGGQSCAPIAAHLEREANVPFRYAVEGAAGVANARNTAVGLAKGRFIAFLDDDEVAKPNWLSDLIKVQDETGADVVFGPIEARLPEAAAEPRSYFQLFFSRLLEGESRLIDKPYGCGNSLLKRETVLKGPTPFNPSTNETGGEDDLLWHDVRAWGGTFAWAKDAWVYEDVPESRASWAYLAKRSFAYGHNTTAQWFDGIEPSYTKVAYSMGRGLLQAIGLAPVSFALWLIRHEKRAWAFDKMMRGLGKAQKLGLLALATCDMGRVCRIIQRPTGPRLHIQPVTHTQS